MELPSWIIVFLVIVGSITLGYYAWKGISLVAYYLRFKEAPRPIDQERLHLLKTENTELKDKITILEKQNEEIIVRILKRLEKS